MSKMKAPLPAPVRHVFGPLVGWLKRNANRRFHGNDGWYLVKDMVLRRMAFPDGADMQILPPKKCWDCTDGVLYKLTAPQRNIFCSKCDGTGNYVPERLVQLERYRMGRYVFHKPGAFISVGPFDFPAAFRDDWAGRWQAKDRIEGLVKHDRNKHPELGYWSRVVLELLFNTRPMVRTMRRHYPRVWKTWVLRKTYRMRDRLGWLTEDERLPF